MLWCVVPIWCRCELVGNKLSVAAAGVSVPNGPKNAVSTEAAPPQNRLENGNGATLLARMNARKEGPQFRSCHISNL